MNWAYEYSENCVGYKVFGMPMPGRTLSGAETYRYAYQGQEKDPETGKEAFQLRLWDGRIGRWLSPDPYGQYFSPYLGMGNNPVNGIDIDGGWETKWGRFWGWVGGGFKGSFIGDGTAADPNHNYGIRYSETTSFTEIDGGFQHEMTITDVYDRHLYLDAGLSGSIGIQAGFKIGVGRFGAGLITSDIGEIGYNSLDGIYNEWGDGTSHNYITGSVAINKNIQVGGRLDYITNETPTSGDLLEYYRDGDNGDLHWAVHGGPKFKWGSKPNDYKHVTSGRPSLKGNIPNKTVTFGIGAKILLGADFTITLGYE